MITIKYSHVYIEKKIVNMSIWPFTYVLYVLFLDLQAVPGTSTYND